MKLLFINIIIFILFTNAYGQVSSRELDGEWLIINNKENYINSDTLKLYRGLDYKSDSNICKVIVWKKHRKNLTINYIGNCIDSSSILNYQYNSKIKIRTENNIQFIDLISAKKTNLSYKILSLKSQQNSINNDLVSVLSLAKNINIDYISEPSKLKNDKGPNSWYYWYLFQFL